MFHWSAWRWSPRSLTALPRRTGACSRQSARCSVRREAAPKTPWCSSARWILLSRSAAGLPELGSERKWAGVAVGLEAHQPLPPGGAILPHHDPQRPSLCSEWDQHYAMGQNLISCQQRESERPLSFSHRQDPKITIPIVIPLYFSIQSTSLTPWTHISSSQLTFVNWYFTWSTPYDRRPQKQS